MTAIRPGDVVRFEVTFATCVFEGVVGSIYDNWAAIRVLEDGGMHNVPLADLTRVREGTPQEFRTATLAVAAYDPNYGDHGRSQARAEALRRGWRERDREDLVRFPALINIDIAGEFIGCVERVGPERWNWELWVDGECVDDGAHLLSQEAAENALLAAENARRKDDTCAKTPPST